LNDDGWIEIMDFYLLATGFGTQGTPINKTDLLLELQSRIDALEQRIPKKNTVVFSAVEFGIEQSHPGFFRNLTMVGGGMSHKWAQLRLPHGVSITNITAFLYDNTDANSATLELWGYNLTEQTFLPIMARVETSSAGYSTEVQTLYNDTISDAQIDNKNCQYALKLLMVGSAYNVCNLLAVIIEYEYPT